VSGLVIYDGYGQTETVNIIANYRCLPVRPGSAGKPVPGFDVQVVDDAGDPVGVGTRETSLFVSSPLGQLACSQATGKIRKPLPPRSGTDGISPEKSAS
jgi:acyl-coenzyme A synthetase/AMP-(fatty) acid ligase